jgi:hypothetical protein
MQKNDSASRKNDNNDRNRANQTMTMDKKKGHRLTFLIISANAHLAHLQSRTSQPTSRALQKSQI